MGMPIALLNSARPSKFSGGESGFASHFRSIGLRSSAIARAFGIERQRDARASFVTCRPVSGTVCLKKHRRLLSKRSLMWRPKCEVRQCTKFSLAAAPAIILIVLTQFSPLFLAKQPEATAGLA